MLAAMKSTFAPARNEETRIARAEGDPKQKTDYQLLTSSGYNPAAKAKT